MPVISIKEAIHLSNGEANQLTRECLNTAMMRLMSEVPPNQITIAEIVELAGERLFGWFWVNSIDWVSPF